MKNITVDLGDIFCYNSPHLIGKAIKWAEKGYSEASSKVSHCGLFVNEGSLQNVNVVEALFPQGVTYRRFWNAYADNLKNVYILHSLNLTSRERLKISNYAISNVGEPYGVLKLLPHLADGVLAKLLHRRDFQFFRAACKIDTFPICSYLVARAYDVVGKDFGIKFSFATPDDIMDFAEGNSDKFEIVQIKV
jgi:uncharacterized protein YycO